MNEDQKFDEIAAVIVKLNPSISTSMKLISLLTKHIGFKAFMHEAVRKPLGTGDDFSIDARALLEKLQKIIENK